MAVVVNWQIGWGSKLRECKTGRKMGGGGRVNRKENREGVNGV